MKMTKGKIVKVLGKDNKTPKALNKWFVNVEYCRDLIIKGRSAMFFYNEATKVTVTSHVEDIKEDENNLILTTENSIYYIKKFE